MKFFTSNLDNSFSCLVEDPYFIDEDILIEREALLTEEDKEVSKRESLSRILHRIIRS